MDANKFKVIIREIIEQKPLLIVRCVNYVYDPITGKRKAVEVDPGNVALGRTMTISDPDEGLPNFTLNSPNINTNEEDDEKE